jgi:hypothetical protein
MPHLILLMRKNLQVPPSAGSISFATALLVTLEIGTVPGDISYEDGNGKRSFDLVVNRFALALHPGTEDISPGE